jgi:transcriptional regulator with XRE-family HTH domain
MNDVAVGRILRALRRQRGWRQVDLAVRGGVSQALVSAIERGHIGQTSIETLRRMFAALDVRIEIVATWRGADLDRLLDEEHARLVARVAPRLQSMGWETVLEVTYNEYGERGSIDIMGLRAAQRAALVVEVKSAIPSTEATGRKVDEKARLAPAIIRSRFGWTPTFVGRIVAVPDTMRLRRLVERQGALRRMFPADFRSLRRWLAQPVGAVAGVWFLSDSSARDLRGARPTRVRVRVPRPIGPAGREPTKSAPAGPIQPSNITAADTREGSAALGPIPASAPLSEEHSGMTILTERR